MIGGTHVFKTGSGESVDISQRIVSPIGPNASFVGGSFERDHDPSRSHDACSLS